MSLLQKIRDDQLVARKARDTDTAASLTTLLSEAARVGLDDGKRESTDAEVVAVAKKFIKNIDETLKAVNDEGRADIEAERALYSEYLPSQMDDVQLTVAIMSIVDAMDGEKSMKMMGPVMKVLKELHDGEYDGKTASGLVKQVLSA